MSMPHTTKDSVLSLSGQIRTAIVFCLFAIPVASQIRAQQGSGPTTDVATLQRQFQHPPDDSRIMMRWWWFGPAVTNAELERELRTMKQGGIGGVEIQPVYPLALDDPTAEI